VIQEHIVGVLEAIREPMGLDRWTITPSVEAIPDARACCSAMPEYREAKILFDLDKLQTNDDLDEIIVHESTHCLTWPLHAVAEHLANALAESMPETHREAMRKLLQEQVRVAAEQVTTDVGHAFLRMFRRGGILDNPAGPQ
jgi:hypothetical protein